MRPALSHETYIPYLVNRAAVAMVGFASSAFARHDVTVPKWRVLFLLWERGACRFGEMAELTSIEPPTLSRLTARMEREKLITRVRIPADTRSIELKLTPAGKRLIEKLLPMALETERIYLDGISKADLAATRSALTRIYENVRRANDAKVRPT